MLLDTEGRKVTRREEMGGGKVTATKLIMRGRVPSLPASPLRDTSNTSNNVSESIGVSLQTAQDTSLIFGPKKYLKQSKHSKHQQKRHLAHTKDT